MKQEKSIVAALEDTGQESNPKRGQFQYYPFLLIENVSVLGQEEGYTVKYIPLPEGVPKGKARGNS